MKITLPYPDRRLSPNARVHWATLSAVKKKARLAAHWETMAQVPIEARQRIAQGEGPIALAVIFHTPDGRHRDLDNAISSLKAGLDGIADALAVNDRRFQLGFAWGERDVPGRVTVEIGLPSNEG